VGAVTHPTCTVATGSFQIVGYDASNSYTFSPSVVSISTTGLVSANTGSYAFTVSNSAGCISLPSASIIIFKVICANDDTIAGENGSTGTPNAGNVLVGNPTNPDTINGTPVTIGLVNLTVTTPATPLTVGAPVPSIDVTTGQVSVTANTPAGTYTIEYSICEKLNPTNCDSASVTVVVTAPQIDAVTETTAPINGLSGGTTPSLVANDTLNGNPVVIGSNPGQVTLTEIIIPSGLTLNPDGTVTVAPNTPAGNYNVEYRICEVTNPSNCDTVTSIIVVSTPAIDAVTETTTPVNGLPGGTTTALTVNDTLNGSPVVVGTAPGNVRIPANTPAGTYPVEYTICEVNNPTNCDTVLSNVVVIAAEIIAKNDEITVDNTLNPVVLQPFSKDYGSGVDTLNGVEVTFDQITVTVTDIVLPGGQSFPVPKVDSVTKEIVIPASVPAGVYTIFYTICEKLNPTNCSDATITITVKNPVIKAEDDVLSSVNGLNGVMNAGNVLVANSIGPDSINGVAATLEMVNITVISPALPIVSGGLVPLLDTATGIVEVPSGTPAGTYTIVYSICDKVNPIVCDEAKVTIEVTCTTTKISGVVRDVLNNRPLSNVPVTLIPDKQTTGPVLLMLTRTDGSYNFTGFAPGDYIIQVQDVNLNSAQNLYNVGPSLYFLNLQNCNYEVRNFEYDKTDLPVLGNFVWYDKNSNGLQDEWFDANNDGVVTQNFPDANGYIDYAKWEWIDFNGDGKYIGKENEGEINAAGLGNGTTDVPNIFITGPNGFSRQITMSIQGYWRSRAPQGNFGDYQVKFVMEPNLEAAAQAKYATGLIKNLSSPLNRRSMDKTAAVQGFVVCGVTTADTRNTTLSVATTVDDSLDFGVQCQLFATIVANDDAKGPLVSSNIVISNVLNVLTNDTFNGNPVVLNEVNLTTVNVNDNLRLNADGNVDVLAGTPAGD